MTRTLVTGATGFVGSHLVRHLIARGDDVHLILRRSPGRVLPPEWAGSVTTHEIDHARETTDIAAALAPEAVFHLATHYLKDSGPDDIAPLIEGNVTFGSNLLEGLLGSTAPVVSTMSYFQFRDGNPAPVSLYSATKQAFLDVCEFYRVVRGLDIRQVVLYDTYGPNDTRSKLIPHLVGSALAGRPVGLGSPDQPLDLLHADDVARGLLAAAEPGNVPMMALRAPSTHLVSEIVATIDELIGSPLPVEYNPSATVNDLVNVSGSWVAPQGWRPTVTLREGLSGMLHP